MNVNGNEKSVRWIDNMIAKEKNMMQVVRYLDDKEKFNNSQWRILYETSAIHIIKRTIYTSYKYNIKES